MTSTFRLDHRVALITGGGTGLGLGIATAMAQAGATVVIAGRRLEMLTQAVASIGPNADAIVHDVDQTELAPALVAEILRRHGRIDILVNNAGIHLKKPVQDITEAEFSRVISTHVLGAHALARACLPDMTARKDGVVINIASMAAIFGIPLVTAYSAAKCALVGMTRTMAVELGTQGVRVNAINPGLIETDRFTRNVERVMHERNVDREGALAFLLSAGGTKRVGRPEEIGALAAFIASAKGDFLQGSVIDIDGGATRSL